MPFGHRDESRWVNKIDPILQLLGFVVAVVGVALTWVVAKKQGLFNRTHVRVSLFNLEENSKVRPELVVGGPHSQHAILTPVLIKIANHGTRTSYNVEVTIDSDSSAIVNHPTFYISPIATDSDEAIEGKVYYLGEGVFRRVFKVAHLHPGKSVQLNNAGLPYNLLCRGESVVSSTLSVTIYEQGKSARRCEFGIWSLDTAQRTFRSALTEMSKKIKSDYEAKTSSQRFLARLLHRHHEHPLRLVEITELRVITIPGEDKTFQTVDRVLVSEGIRFGRGHLFVGPIGLI